MDSKEKLIEVNSKEIYFLTTKSSLQRRLLCVCTILIFVISCFLYFCCDWFMTQRQQTLGDILPETVSMTISVRDDIYAFAGNTPRTIDVTWDAVSGDFSYRESRRLTYEDTVLYASVIITQDQAVLTVSSRNTSKTLCFKEIESIEWYKILSLLPVAVESNVKSKHGCHGDVWTFEVDTRVEVCVIGSDIKYIRYGDTTGEIIDVQSNFNHQLKILNPSCRISPSKILVDIEKPNVKIHSDKYVPEKKPCLFIHGAGLFENENIFKVSDKLLAYWGDISSITTKCASHRFVMYNSVDNGWDSAELHQKICNVATGGAGPKIQNLKIFSHSLGNLLFAAALHRKVCELDRTTSEWYTVQAPWRGSEIADKIACYCDKTCTVFDLPRFIPADIIKLTKYCHRNGSLTRAYECLRLKYKSPLGITFQDLVATARQTISGAVCGQSPWGMGSSWPDSVGLDLLQFATNLGHPNDGLVAFKSCNITGNFTSDYRSKFYTNKINHAEGTCRFGIRSGHFSSGHPCLWYSSM